MLEITITIRNDNEHLTDTEKAVLRALAGDVTVTKTITAPVVEAPTEEATVPTKGEKQKASKTPRQKPKVIEVETVAPTPTTTEPIVEVETEVVPTPTETDIMDAAALNEYAKNNAKPEYGPHYRAILKEYGVSKFKNIPAEKVVEAKNKLDQVFASVV